MNAADLKKAKKRVRTHVRALRDALTPDERQRLSASIAERLLAMPELATPRTVMAFWSFGSEVDTAGLLESLHRNDSRVALPRIAEGEMQARTYAPGDAIALSAFGAGEPVGGEVLRPDQIDVIVTPAVAFDRSGARVGYGGGYYDRFFARTRAEVLRVGICFAVQVVAEPLPRGHFDLGVDAIVTEHETVHCVRVR